MELQVDGVPVVDALHESAIEFFLELVQFVEEQEDVIFRLEALDFSSVMPAKTVSRDRLNMRLNSFIEGIQSPLCRRPDVMPS